MQGSILIPPDQRCEGLHKVVILRLMGRSATRKSSNEYEFFVAVTSSNKIGEERIRDLTGDILFPMTFKYPAQKPSRDIGRSDDNFSYTLSSIAQICS